jgi:hypothetical protein
MNMTYRIQLEQRAILNYGVFINHAYSCLTHILCYGVFMHKSVPHIELNVRSGLRLRDCYDGILNLKRGLKPKASL